MLNGHPITDVTVSFYTNIDQIIPEAEIAYLYWVNIDFSFKFYEDFLSIRKIDGSSNTDYMKNKNSVNLESLLNQNTISRNIPKFLAAEIYCLLTVLESQEIKLERHKLISQIEVQVEIKYTNYKSQQKIETLKSNLTFENDWCTFNFKHC